MEHLPGQPGLRQAAAAVPGVMGYQQAVPAVRVHAVS